MSALQQPLSGVSWFDVSDPNSLELDKLVLYFKKKKVVLRERMFDVVVAGSGAAHHALRFGSKLNAGL